MGCADALTEFETPRLMRISDWKVALLHNLLRFGVFVYTIYMMILGPAGSFGWLNCTSPNAMTTPNRFSGWLRLGAATSYLPPPA